MFFKVGDLVTVRSDLQGNIHYRMDNSEEYDYVVPEMEEWIGKKAIIVEIDECGEYYITEDNNEERWCWTDEMFEEYINQKNIKE